MIKGTVQKIHKNGKAYSIKVDEAWFGFGYEKPQFEEGRMVKFETTERNGYKNVDHSTFKLGKQQEVAEETEPTPAKNKWPVKNTSVGHGASKDEYWANKEKRDLQNDKDRSVGASRNTSIEFIKLLIGNGGIKLPTKANDIEKTLVTLIDYYADYFMTHTPGDDATPAIKGIDVDDSPEDIVVEEVPVAKKKGRPAAKPAGNAVARPPAPKEPRTYPPLSEDTADESEVDSDFDEEFEE